MTQQILQRIQIDLGDRVRTVFFFYEDAFPRKVEAEAEAEAEVQTEEATEPVTA